MARKPISKKLRFEVFKRDSFKCQYCGKSSPDVILHVDHIHPVSKGGENELINLITSCVDCNLGKSDRLISDDSAIKKQQEQLQQLNERRQQLEMMLKWREGLRDIKSDSIAVVVQRINDEFVKFNRHVNDFGKEQIGKWLHKFSLSEILDAIEEACAGKGIQEEGGCGDFFDLIPRIAGVRRKPEGDRRLYYIRGILRRRTYVNERVAMGLMRDALERCGDIEWIEAVAKSAKNWTDFRTTLEEVAYGQD